MTTTIKLGFFPALIAIASCECYSPTESVSPIADTELPETVAAGETISFKIYHVVFNGCGKFSRQETTIDGKTITVKFYGKYPGCRICTDNIPTLETTYKFDAKEKGDYYFRFYQDNFNGQEFLLDTLSAQ